MTEAEIQAAAKAIQAVEDPLEAASEFVPAARAALEAAERVRFGRPREACCNRPKHLQADPSDRDRST